MLHFPDFNMIMNEIIEIAKSMLSGSEQRLELISHNIANTSTAGYKAQVSFSHVLAQASQATEAGQSISQSSDNISVLQSTNMSQGQLSRTGSPLDFAISGEGFFKLRSGDDVFYSRQGQFKYVTGGRLMTAQGHYLQNAMGGDVVLSTLAAKVTPDGTVLENGLPVDTIGIFAPQNQEQISSLGGTLFAADEAVMSVSETALVRQGMIEAANVVAADEMVKMMASIREAEIGSRLVQTYDTLIGQAISTFGQS